jgi:PAS domain S-box-containing protein
MDFNILRVKCFNALVYVLMGFQLAILIGIAIIMLSAISDIDMVAIFSMSIMFLLGLPLLIILYLSSNDKILKTIFFGITANIAILSVSGIIWYILAESLNSGWLVQVAKALMVIGYIPLIYALYKVFKASEKKLNWRAKVLIGFINLSCSITILFYALTHIITGDTYDIVIYAITTLSDIVVLALLAMLIIVYSPTRLRYILSIVFCFILLSFVGDSLNLVGAMRLNAYGLESYSSFFYDAMFIFLLAALLLYSLHKDMSITTVEEVDKKLHDTRHVMDDFIMQSPDATCIYDPDGNVVMANDLFLQMFDITRERLASSFNLFKHTAVLDCGFEENVDQLKNGKTFVRDKVKLTLRNGKALNIAFKAFPMYMSDGSISRYATVVEDISDRVRAEEELLQAKTQAELYMDLMGHDINNMNQIGMGYLEMALEAEELSDRYKALIAKPLEAMGNSSRLIDNVRKLRRAKTGDFCLKPVDLGKVLTEVVRDLSAVPGRDVAIDYEVGENCSVMANELLKDIFINLVGNSIKHSTGPLLIRVKQETIEENGKRYYRVIVEDNGPGVSDDLKPIIFDRIYRSKTRLGGNGLGLYLVKALVDNFKGTIVLEDRVAGERDKGSRFIVTLPSA